MSFKAIMMKRIDRVAVALENIPKGAVVGLNCQGQSYSVELLDAIEFGHKFAVVAINEGEDILKYGEVIGEATRDISAGEHVHVHNLAGKRGRGDLIGKSS